MELKEKEADPSSGSPNESKSSAASVLRRQWATRTQPQLDSTTDPILPSVPQLDSTTDPTLPSVGDGEERQSQLSGEEEEVKSKEKKNGAHQDARDGMGWPGLVWAGGLTLS